MPLKQKQRKKPNINDFQADLFDIWLVDFMAYQPLLGYLMLKSFFKQL